MVMLQKHESDTLGWFNFFVSGSKSALLLLELVQLQLKYGFGSQALRVDRPDRPQRRVTGKEDQKTCLWKQGEGTDLSNLAKRGLRGNFISQNIHKRWEGIVSNCSNTGTVVQGSSLEAFKKWLKETLPGIVCNSLIPS